MTRLIRLYLGQQDGATAIEYGLIAALISLAIAATVFIFGNTLSNLFFVQLLGMLPT
jgi:pilus assembly protein Flp/PilA